MRIFYFRRWVIFELLIDVVFGCWEYRRKKGNERKIIFLNFFLFVVLGLSTQFSRFVVGGLWVCCVHERILMGFGD